ncbi:MAG: mannose-1-phosphate guanylyltransferase [Gemmatimonadetes bacterium]|nr:mannose-1-phosphate guanylyltransferase [Gemmatimonadota bacterium]
MPGSTKSSTRADAHLWITVLAGGSGSRFWPVSTPTRPKQLLPLAGARPLVVETIERARAIAPDARIRILAGAALVPPLRSVLPDLGVDAYWVEPQARGTAPALAWAAWRALREDPDAVLVSLHSDHAIRPLEAFVEGMRAAALLAERERALVTVGVEPDRPEIGYGYLQPGARFDPADGVPAFRVSAFHEKPDLATAVGYVRAGHLWNSGIFAWRADVFLEEVRRHARGLSDALPLLDEGDVDGFFDAVTPISVDEAVLERSDRVAAIQAPFLWDDVGSWEGLARAREAEPGENVVVGTGRVVDGGDNIVYAEGGAVILWGLSDVVAVHTAGTTLVMRRDLAPDLKRLLDRLPEHLRQAPR